MSNDPAFWSLCQVTRNPPSASAVTVESDCDPVKVLLTVNSDPCRAPEES
ncbi:MAG: hypothetical protein U1E21_16405 [Reyranellaceae bacterium]